MSEENGAPVAEAENGKATYDPSGDMVKLGSGRNARDYLQVKDRLKWLRSDHPLARITTEALEIGEDRAVFKATISTPDGAEAHGHGSETQRDFGDFIEKAETKAIGRACAALGYGTQFVEGELEGKQGERPVDAPVQRSQSSSERRGSGSRDNTSGSGGSTHDGRVSSEQVRNLRALASSLKVSTPDLGRMIREHFGKGSLNDLSQGELNALQELLNDRAGSGKGMSPDGS